MPIKMRDHVEDIITGFHGTVVARAEYMNGCIRFGVQPRVAEAGKLPEWQWIDEPDLVVVENAQETVPLEVKGGPFEAPPRF